MVFKKFVALTIASLMTVSMSINAFAADISTGNVSRGVVSISHKSTSGKRLKVIIQKGNGKYTYNLRNDGVAENYPLQMGSGTYNITVLENVTGNKYAVLKTEAVNANIPNQNVVFLNSIQNVNWNPNQAAIKQAVNLQNNNSIYDYVIKNISYDYNKAKNVQNDYNPSIDNTFKSKKGICYDYSSLFGGMDRSRNIPTKLVKGYCKGVNGYHAWNEVLINGKWQIVDSTYDAAKWGGGAKYNMVKNPGDYKKVYEY